MIVLGIETSCDETAVGIVELTDPKQGATLIANSVASSLETHIAYGGVVPELAARAHYESMNYVIGDAVKIMQSALGLSSTSGVWAKIDAISVTEGAGLGGCLQIGIMAAKTLALLHDKPLYGCNHVEGHVYANFITQEKGLKVEGLGLREAQAEASVTSTPKPYALCPTPPSFPMLSLIVSGGHTQLVYFKNHFDYFLIGRTTDDAIGEAFDKVAKMTGLPYPGGPSIAKAALEGDEKYFKLPISKMSSIAARLTQLRELSATKGLTLELTGRDPSRSTLDPYTAGRPETFVGQDGTHNPEMLEESLPNFAKASSGKPSNTQPAGLDFSFSGLKTAVLRALQLEVGQDITFPSSGLPDLLSELQKCNMAASFQKVAVETVVQKTLLAYEEFGAKSVVIAGGVAANTKLRERLSEVIDIPILYTDIRLCTDNGAMIATLGAYKALLNHPPSNPTTLEANPSLVM